MRLAAAVVLIGLLAGLLGAAGLARADGPSESSEPPVEGWSADPRLWLALIEWRQRLRLELESSRELCTAGTLTGVSWEISGGKPPYALQVEGVSVDAGADNARINCGALSEAEAADGEAALAAKRVNAVVTDSRGVRREAALEVTRARALPAPTGVWYQTNVGGVTVSWDEVEGAGSQSPTIVSGNDRRRVTGVMRTRPNRDGAAWSYQTVTRLYADEWDLGPTSGVQVLSVAAVRHPLETETPGALNWSDNLEYASTTLAQNVTLTATHDTVTASWDRQPYAGGQQVLVTLHERSQVDRRGDRRASGYRFLQLWEQEGVGGRHRVTFSHLPPDTDLRLAIEMHHYTGDAEEPDYFPDTTSHNVRTLPAPAGWVPVPAGPQNLRYTEANGSITVTWDDPYSNAEPNWFLTIENPLTGARWVTWVSGTSWSLPADLVVLPDTQYRVTVEHIDVVVGSASILFRTPPAPATGHAGPPDAPDVSPRELRLRALRTFFPIWPMAIDGDYAVIDGKLGKPGETVGTVVTDSHEATPDETTALRYNAYDAAGEAASAGSYAFLSGADGAASVVATYEGLRDGTAKRLLIHKSDTQGVSRATLYDAVAAGDFSEWRESDDCWVRYRVTEVLPDPPGSAPRKLLAVEWTTYAFTGCSGAIAADTAVVFDWGPLPDLGGPSLAVPIRHGPFQIVPEGWEGQVEEDPFRPWPANSYAKSVVTADLAEARRLPHWRDPTLPSGWTLLLASSGDPSYDPPYGYCAFWANDRGYGGVEICGGFHPSPDQPVESSWHGGVVETRMIAGRPTFVVYSPPGPNHNRYYSIQVWIYDPATAAAYDVNGYDWTLTGNNVDAVIAIARSLFEE